MSAIRRIRLPVRALLASDESRWKPSPPAISLASDLSPAAVHALITLCPIGVTSHSSGGGDYVVRYGRRTIQLARAVLEPGEEIEVTLHAEHAPDLEVWRLLDLLLVPVLLGPPSEDATVLEWVTALDSGALRSAEAEAMGLNCVKNSTALRHVLGIHGRKLSEARSAIDQAPSDG